MPKKKIKLGSREYDYENESIDRLLSTLASYDFTPKMDVSSQAQGYGDYTPSKNSIRIHPNGGSEDIISHELTHSVDNLMGKESANIKKNRDPSLSDLQFDDAYGKLDPGKTKLPMAPIGRGYDSYRQAPGEMRGWGVGNMSSNSPIANPLSPTQPHVDATMATEFEILQDLLNKRKKK